MKSQIKDVSLTLWQTINNLADCIVIEAEIEHTVIDTIAETLKRFKSKRVKKLKAKIEEQSKIYAETLKKQMELTAQVDIYKHTIQTLQTDIDKLKADWIIKEHQLNTEINTLTERVIDKEFK
jgi:Zn finger protein HypA/HybF involved in hydrogenase expression